MPMPSSKTTFRKIRLHTYAYIETAHIYIYMPNVLFQNIIYELGIGIAICGGGGGAYRVFFKELISRGFF